MERPAEYLDLLTYYRTTEVDGLSICSREAGPKVAPTLLIQGRLLCQTR
jgi:hypothetical protein